MRRGPVLKNAARVKPLNRGRRRRVLKVTARFVLLDRPNRAAEPDLDLLKRASAASAGRRPACFACYKGWDGHCSRCGMFLVIKVHRQSAHYFSANYCHADSCCNQFRRRFLRRPQGLVIRAAAGFIEKSSGLTFRPLVCYIVRHESPRLHNHRPGRKTLRPNGGPFSCIHHANSSEIHAVQRPNVSSGAREPASW